MGGPRGVLKRVRGGNVVTEAAMRGAELLAVNTEEMEERPQAKERGSRKHWVRQGRVVP